MKTLTEIKLYGTNKKSFIVELTNELRLLILNMKTCMSGGKYPISNILYVYSEKDYLKLEAVSTKVEM